MPEDWQRDKDLGNLVHAIEDDPDIQLGLLRNTSDKANFLRLGRQGQSTERYPFEQLRPYQLATMSIQQRVLGKARSHLGEAEDRFGRSVAGVWYAHRVKNSDFITAPWCDMFAGMVMDEVGGEELLAAAGCFALTTAHAQFLHDKGVTNRPDVLSPGALAFQNWDRTGVGNAHLGEIDHVEFVKEDHGDGTATYVGGNVGNAVKETRRRKAYLVVQAEWWKLYRPPFVSSAATDDSFVIS